MSINYQQFCELIILSFSYSHSFSSSNLAVHCSAVQCCCCLSDSNCLLPLPLTPKKSLQTGTRLSFAGHCHPSSKGANYFSAFFSKHLSPSFPFFDFSGLVTLSPTFSSFFFLLLLLLLLLFLLPNFSALSSSSQSLTFWWTVFN